MDIYKRVFKIDCIPVATPLGNLLTNSMESREIQKAFAGAKKGEVLTVKLSQDTLDRIEILKLK